MEKFGHDKKYRDFEDAIGRRVHEIGRARNSETKVAQEVVERLFNSNLGDPSDITDVDIINTYNAVEE